MAKRPKANPVRGQVKQALDDLADATRDGSADASKALEGPRSHIEIHCADTAPEYFGKNRETRTLRDRYFADPTLCDVPRLCVARAIEKGADQTQSEQRSYFPDRKSMRLALANNIMRNSRKIASFYCDDRQIRPDEPLVSHTPTTNPAEAPSGRTISQDPRTGAIRESYARSTALVIEHDQMTTPRATPKLTGLHHVTFYPFAPTDRQTFETGRDLRCDVSCTRQFAESGQLGKGRLLACANPNVRPVENQYVEYVDYRSGQKVEQLQIPIHGGNMTLTALKSGASLMMRLDGVDEPIRYQDKRFDENLDKNENADQRDFLGNVLLEMRNPQRHLPKTKNTKPVASADAQPTRPEKQPER